MAAANNGHKLLGQVSHSNEWGGRRQVGLAMTLDAGLSGQEPCTEDFGCRVDPGEMAFQRTALACRDGGMSGGRWEA